MRRILGMIVAFCLVGAVGVMPTAGAGPEHKNRYSNDNVITVPCPQEDGESAGTIRYVGPLKLWPPNHKYQQASVTATDEDSGDDVTLTTTGTHDQYAEGGEEINGAGNTTDDITPAAQTDVMGEGSATQNFQIRAERSGTVKEGRTYTITADAVFTDSDGDGSSEEMTSCHAEFTIVVPHDMRPSNR